MKLQSELRRALDVLIDEHENVKLPSHSNIKSIMTFVEVAESRVSKVNLLMNRMAIQLYLKIF